MIRLLAGLALAALLGGCATGWSICVSPRGPAQACVEGVFSQDEE